jgi:hypothetical protein
VVDGVVAFFVKDQTWLLSGDKDVNREHRHAAAFIHRRAVAVLVENPAWRTATDKLVGRLKSELNAVRAYLTSKLGDTAHRGPLFGGPGDATPPHLDLADKAQRRTNDPATTLAQALANPGSSGTRGLVNTYLGQRRNRVKAIVWRATAIHDELWTPSADHSTAVLDTIALSEVLDRRLRIVEWMNYVVSDHHALGPDSRRVFRKPTSGWEDGFRIRSFEYPRFGPST